MEIAEKELILNNLMMRCEILTKDNRLLFLGKISEFDEENEIIKLEDYKDSYNSIPVVNQGDKIKVQVKNSQKEKQIIIFEGSTVQSFNTSLSIHIENIISKEDGRGNFRQNVMCKCMISSENSPNKEKPCVIIDISVTGIGIESVAEYQEGENILIINKRFRIQGPAHNLKCKILRKKLLDNDYFYYGCQFIDVNENEENNLFKDIFALQGEALRAKR